MPARHTSWGNVAGWYDDHLEQNEDTYQRQVILPNLARILGVEKGMRIMDIACGQGFFSRELQALGAEVVGADISKELIATAKASSKGIDYKVAPAHALPFAKNDSFDAAIIVLAIQNIEEMTETFIEASRILKPRGRLVLVVNHPAFRVPKRSSWGYDEETKTQYRRVDGYLSGTTNEIMMHPGKKGSETTVSYHRSLQDFFKALSKAGFAVTKLEEWISHKKSEKGPRAAAEDRARKEIPLFLALEATKF